jgi:hypothetical protein
MTTFAMPSKHTDTFRVCIPMDIVPPMCVYRLVQRMLVDGTHHETHVVTFFVQRGNTAADCKTSVTRRQTF